MKALTSGVMIFAVILECMLAGCGGSSTSKGVSPTPAFIPMTSAVSLIEFKNIFYGKLEHSTSGTHFNFSLQGHDTNGNVCSGNYMVASIGQVLYPQTGLNQIFNSSSVGLSINQINANYISLYGLYVYSLDSNGTLFINIDNNLSPDYVFENIELPDSVKVGDKGVLYRDGQHSSTWYINQSISGTLDLVINRNFLLVSYSDDETDRFTLDRNGKPVEMGLNISVDGKRYLLSGPLLAQ